MIRINKSIVFFLLLSFSVFSCNGDDFSGYLSENKLIEVANFHLEKHTIHIALKNDEYVENFSFLDNALDLSSIQIIVTVDSQIIKVVEARTYNGKQPVYNDGKIFLIACTTNDETGDRLIFLYDDETGYKEFRIDYNKIIQLQYFNNKIYTTWDKSTDYLRIIDIDSGRVIIPKTEPMFYGFLFPINTDLYAINYNYNTNEYTETYLIRGDNLVPYKDESFTIPERSFPVLDDYLIR